MTERDLNRGTGLQPEPTYADAGNPARDIPTSQAAQDAGLGTTTGQAAEAGIVDKAKEDWRGAKSAARVEISHATEKAKEAAAGQKDFAAEQVGGIAAAIGKVGDELQQGDQAAVGRYAKQIGSSVQRFADDIKGKDMGQIAGMAEDFGRQNPAAFLGIAALAGFAASRFLTASADRRSRPTTSRNDAGTTRSPSTPASPATPGTDTSFTSGYQTGGTYNG
ncbi:nutrient deprivation-induced protein [Neorhizobium alkalisoli]|uniref:nutrient deprivation-induced protein n=1 Tax=Neorhizobium alkalisoli TaxID=528178 RepID=UPI003159EE58